MAASIAARSIASKTAASVTIAVNLPESFWRSLRHLNQYRLFLAFSVTIGAWAFPQYAPIDEDDLQLFLASGVLYGTVAILLAGMERARQFDFDRQLMVQVGVDIVAISWLMHLSGGILGGLGLLLIVPVAASGMLPAMRAVLVAASVATLLLLLEQLWRSLGVGSVLGSFVRTSLLSIGLFAVAVFSHALARGARTAAELAGEKGRQVEHLARINARVIQELPFGVLVVDSRGAVLLANSQAEEQLRGNFHVDCTLGHCSPYLAELWTSWRREGKAQTYPFQVAQTRLRARFIELEPERQAGAIVVIEDVTELEAEAQRMKLAALGRLTANLAHEIRNPLSAVNHAAQLLKEGQGPEVQGRLCKIIEDNAQRLSWLVDDVLSLNRRDRLDQETLNVADSLAAFVEEFQRNEQVPDGAIRLEIEAGTVVGFDRMHLQQILWNLCRNAWHYCSKGPASIRIAARGAATKVDIDIFNDGPPVDAGLREHLFEPFYTTNQQGSGLGLYISRELAEANRARLRYVEHPGGALFRLSCQLSPH